MAISVEQGVQIHLIPMTWDQAIEALEMGTVDAVQGMSKTRQREDRFDLSMPLLINEQVIFVDKATQFIVNLDDMTGRRIAYQSGDVNFEQLDKLEGVQLVGVRDQLEGLGLLQSGQVDVFIGNKLTGLYNMQKQGWTQDTKIVGEAIERHEYGIAVAKGNGALLQVLDKGLHTIKANGTYDKIYNKWFGMLLVDAEAQRSSSWPFSL